MSETDDHARPPKAKMPGSHLVETTVEHVRNEPVKALVWSFAAGILLAISPVSRIIGLLADVFFALLRPVLLLLGLAKVSELLGEKRQ